MEKPPLFSRKRWSNISINVALILVCIFAMLPIATTVLISFKTQQDITRKPPVIFPCDTESGEFKWSECRWATEGYHRVLAPEPSDTSPVGFALTGNLIKTYIPNTLLYAFTASFVVMLLAALSGYAFSRFRFKGHGALMTGILAITGVPLLTNLLALYQMGIDLRKADMPFYDDRIFIIIVYTGFYLPLSVWIAKGFFDAIPRELEEAALIDGLGPIRALMQITLPLAMPGMMSVFLLTFVSVWNEFIAGYLLISKNEYKPVMFGLYDFLSQNIINLQVLAAACIIIASPIVILFLFTRRTFFKAMVEGALKG